MPLVFLVFPFIILQIKGIPISFSQYLDTLKDIAKSHFIGKALSIENFSFETIFYFLFTAGLYFLQMYQNTMACIKYYETVKRMNTTLCDMREYLANSISTMDSFVQLNNKIPHYSDFCQDVYSHKLVLEEIYAKIGPLTRFCCYDPNKWLQLGHMLNCYYQLYSCMDYEESLRYSVGFEGYINILSGIGRKYQSGSLGKCEFAEDRETVFFSQYYPPHGLEENCVKNKCDLSTNLIITGVNASGKTTMLKTATINIIISQQFGFGFYKSCVLKPYQHIHSYINIPDTSGRDSLFQAESRRCKEILDKITQTPNDRHFCIFDELYSGTNPKEAAKSAYSLLRYLSNNENVRFILTTHYVSVCKKFKNDPKVKNYKMSVDVDETGTFTYTYRLKPGISKLEGGLTILKNMDYPSEIINDIQNNQR